jgi:rhodanese-related sulfurtransferase
MSDIQRVSPAEAKRLCDDDGYVYVDVRSVPEFEAEHPQGAYNVPLMHAGPGGMTSNPDFVKVVEATFAKDAKLVLGCRGGNRSLRALQLLQQRGFTRLVDQRAGFDAARDAFGGVTEPGWKSAGLPVSTGAGGDRAWATLASKA